MSGGFVFIVAHAGDELLLLGACVRESLSHLSHFHVEGVFQVPLGLANDIFNRVGSWTWLRILLNPPRFNALWFLAHEGSAVLGLMWNPVGVVLTYSY